ncbi:MAG: recombinase family protein [Candidatus Omnitrophota bacterium]
MKAALYTRVSTEDQAREGFSLEVQRNYLLQYANNFGWETFCSLSDRDIYMDDGYSGGTLDRPAMQRLLLDARNKRFDLVLVYKQDRLSRRLKDLLALLEEFDSLGVGYKSATEPFDTTSSAGKMAIQMLGSCAEFERNRLIERVFPGMLMGAQKGQWQGARYAPYGYKYNKESKKLELFEDEARIVREIFTMYRHGKSTSQIAGHYYNLGIPLTGVLKCHECGLNFRGCMSLTNHRTREKKPWYRCSSKGVSYIICGNASVSAEDINKQVWDIIDTICRNLHVMEELSDMIKLSSTEPEERYVEALEAKQLLVNKNLEKQKGLYEVFSQDGINLDIYKEKAELLRNEEKRLRQEIKAVQLKILEKRNAVNLTQAAQDFLVRLRNSSKVEEFDYLVKTFMRIIFKGIYINNKEIVKVEINQPWKMCYESGLKLWNKQIKKEGRPAQKVASQRVYSCVPTDVK